MGRASRTTLVATVGVVVALGALLVAGRLTGRALQRPGGPATAMTVGGTSPRLPLVRKVALSHPVDGVAVADDGGVWIVHHGRGIVWAHSDQRLVGFAPDHTRGRTLDEAAGAIRALAAGRDALWVGAPAGLFRVDFDALP